jgi:hypothetical protein
MPSAQSGRAVEPTTVMRPGSSADIGDATAVQGHRKVRIRGRRTGGLFLLQRNRRPCDRESRVSRFTLSRGRLSSQHDRGVELSHQ